MYNFTVYQHKFNDTFRVTAGDHVTHESVALYNVRVYQGHDRQSAIDTAYANEEDAKIREQIERFGVSVHEFKIGDIVKPARSLPNFDGPARISEIRRRKNNGQREYAVLNGAPNNLSVRWYVAIDLQFA